MHNYNKQQNSLKRLGKDLRKYSGAYLLVIPVVLYYLIFCYKPMYGIIIAFKNFRPGKGIWGSDWVGLQHFIDFFGSFYFSRVLTNTLVISITTLLINFPIPIILALLLNEVKNQKFKRITQTVSYMPHFISMVVFCGLIKIFVSDKGVITSIVSFLGGPEFSLLNYSEYFVPIYVLSDVWKEMGWKSIIYLAALSGVDQELYEAAKVDGAGRWQQMLHVTIPGISGTIIIMLLLSLGSLMSLGHEKIILLYNPSIYETADVISTFVYRKGLLSYEWSYSTAVGLFNSVINFILVMFFNTISKKVTEVGLW